MMNRANTQRKDHWNYGYREGDPRVRSVRSDDEEVISELIDEFEDDIEDAACGWSGCSDALSIDEATGMEGELESVGMISASDYIKWVQRSLNRLYRLNIRTDGKITSAYREGLRRFNNEYLGRIAYGDIDERSQNQLMVANEGDEQYVKWAIRALNKAGFGPLPVTFPLTTTVVKAIKSFQKDAGLKRDGYIGSKTELALIKAAGILPPGEFRKKVTPRPKKEVIKPTVKPLTAKRVTLLVWALTGRRPDKVSSARLAVEFARFVELKKLIRKPSLLHLFIHSHRIFWKTVSTYFAEEPERQFGALVGGAYAIMDVAARRGLPRKLKPGSTRAQRKYSSGFNKGYPQMHSHMSKLVSDPDVKRILRRLAAGRPKSVTLGRVYRALHEVAISKMGGKSLSYLTPRRNCRFNYPGVKTSCKV